MKAISKAAALLFSLVGATHAQQLVKEYIHLNDRLFAIENAVPPAANTSGTLSAVSAMPGSGAGSNQTFTFTFSKNAGGAGLNVVIALFNRTLDGSNACQVAYNVPSDILYLIGNDGSTLLTVAAGKTNSGSNSNSQCTASVTGSSTNPWASSSGNNTSITVNLQFSASAWTGSAFNPDKVIYMMATDTASNVVGWSPMGTWRPSAASLPSPDNGVYGNGGGRRQTFSITYRKPASASFGNAQLLFNGSINGNNACFMQYSAAGNSWALQTDSNSGNVGYFQFNTTTNGVLAIGNSSTGSALSNTQCTLYSVSRMQQGDLEVFTMDIGFTDAFKAATWFGRVIGYAGIQDSLGGNSDWAPVIAWSLNY